MISSKPSRGFRSLLEACPKVKVKAYTTRRCPRAFLFTAPSQHRHFHQSRWHREQATGASKPAFIENFKNTLTFPPPTHDISELVDPKLQDQEVVLHGYCGTRRDANSNLSFVIMLSRDLTHQIQLVSTRKGPSSETPKEDAHPYEKLKHAKPHAPIIVRGRLKPREKPGRPVGDLVNILTTEIEPLEVWVLNDLPKEINMTQAQPPELHFLRLRTKKSDRDALLFRSKVATICRDWLQNEKGFTEIETPLLFKSTSEGAREFIVPTRRSGLAYALPQSPQQYKQILMASGFSRYFQLARCFRDEDLRADRQPEFTQLDLEMSFVKGEDVVDCVETLIRALWHHALQVELPRKFLQMTYHEAMSKYGSDKPDLRLDYQIFRIDHLLPADLISKISPLIKPAVDVTIIRTGKTASDPNRTRQFIGEFLDHADNSVLDEQSGAPGVFVYDSSKPLQGLHAFGFEAAEEIERLLEPMEGDLILLQARLDNPRFFGGSTTLGRLVTALHRAAIEREFVQPPDGIRPLWVTDFPLFSPSSSAADEPGQSGASGLSSTHHPFTSPKTPADVDLLHDNPTEAVADHYDLVVNGVELGGGSRRIHHSEMQRYIMEHVLKMPEGKIQEFNHLLRVLSMGCPPHAGFALGFDRLIAVMLGKESVREVIAFPKFGKEGEDYVVGAPSEVSDEHWEKYGLKAIGDVKA